MPDSPRVEYYRGNCSWIASLDRGNEGLFRLLEGEDAWTFIAPGGVGHRGICENIYRNGHDYDPVRDPAGLEGLPPLPPMPSVAPIAWRDNFLPKEPIRAAGFPAVAAAMAGSPGASIRIWLLLSEDRWESRYGDGCFLYFAKKAFLDEAAAELEAGRLNAAARAKAAQASGGSSGDFAGIEYSLASIDLALEEGSIAVRRFEPGGDDHYGPLEVLAALEKSLAAGSP